jgi:hypothetical protein
MSETSSARPTLWFAVAAVVVAAAVWATVAMAASNGSGSDPTSNGAPSPVASYDFGGPPHHSMYAADGDQANGDCPNMGGDDGGSGGGGSTTPSTPETTPAPSAPSTQDGSSNPSL